MGETRRESMGDIREPRYSGKEAGLRDEASNDDIGGDQSRSVRGSEISEEVQGQQEETARVVPITQDTLDRIARNIEKGVKDDSNIRSQEYYSRMGLDVIKTNQGQQKIDQDQQKMMQDMALKLTELEIQVGQQLDGEFQANMLVFDPKTGDFK